MELSEILEQINDIFITTLKNTQIELTDETTAKDIAEWDSLTNIILISEIERSFNIQFRLSEVLKLKNIGELCVRIQNKLE